MQPFPKFYVMQKVTRVHSTSGKFCLLFFSYVRRPVYAYQLPWLPTPMMPFALIILNNIEPGSEMYGHYFRTRCTSVCLSVCMWKKIMGKCAVARFSDTELTCGHLRTKEFNLFHSLAHHRRRVLFNCFRAECTCICTANFRYSMGRTVRPYWGTVDPYYRKKENLNITLES